MSKRGLLFLFLAIFLFRLMFGLLNSRWDSIDEIQTYLIGLKCLTTGTWPYFGPDLAGNENPGFHSQIPGALEGLLIALPLRLAPFPESPYVLVNLMSTLAVFLLAWYIRKRIPSLSFPWLCVWIAVVPWSIQEATRVLNPSYIFLPSVIFTIGFLETMPGISTGRVSLPWANFFMGFAVFWIMQFHFSWVYFAPLVVFSWLIQLRQQMDLKPLLFFILGGLPPFIFMVPTLLKYGFESSGTVSGFLISFNKVNFMKPHILLGRFLSLPCFEVPRWIGGGTQERLSFLTGHPYLALPGAFLWVLGILQAVILFLAWFKRKSVNPGWRELKLLLLGVFAMVYASFWYTTKEPMTHIYFVFFPLVMVYSCYVWSAFGKWRFWGISVALVLIASVFFQGAWAWEEAPRQCWLPSRAPILRAIQERDYRPLGERRAGSLY